MAILTDVSNLTDRDILIRLDTKMEQAESNQKALMVRQEELERSTRATIIETERAIRAAMLENSVRITALEHDAAVRSGFFSGAKALWALIISVPAAFIAYLVGQQ